MKVFQLAKQTASLNFQSRTENNGTEKVAAATCHLTMTLPNDALVMFDPKLREAFYRKQLKGEDEMDLADQGSSPKDGLNRLKFPHIGSDIEWDEVFEEYTLAVDYGVSKKSAISLGGCKVDAFKIGLMDGGSLTLKFRVSCHPSEEQAGKLYTLNGREITFNLEPPADGGKQQKQLEEAEA